MTDDESTKTLAMLNGHVSRLREQGFDTVSIFCSKYDDKNGTRFWEVGGGNYCGRFGHVSLWMEKEKQTQCRKENNE